MPEMKRWWLEPDKRWLTSDEVIEWLRANGPFAVKDGPRGGLNVYHVLSTRPEEPDWWFQSDWDK